MDSLSIAVVILVEMDRCPRCLREGTIHVTGHDGEIERGVCGYCEAVVRIARVTVQIPEGEDADEADG